MCEMKSNPKTFDDWLKLKEQDINYPGFTIGSMEQASDAWRAATLAERDRLKKHETCTWTADKFGVFQTGCLHYIDIGGDGYCLNYCPYCGKRLEIAGKEKAE